MANPRVGDELFAKRVVRYLKKYPTLVVCHGWQDEAAEITVYTDSDWGGCVKTRRSTSGGIAMRGNHLICHWARTQQLIALSSAEAELNAAVKACQEGLGLAHLEEEIGTKMLVRILGDSSANNGIIQRQGSGKVKHLSVRQLWIQQQAELGVCVHTKIPRLLNSADMCTHHFTKAEAENHLSRLFCQRGCEGD
jgi:hypothetical protein